MCVCLGRRRIQRYAINTSYELRKFSELDYRVCSGRAVPGEQDTSLPGTSV